MERLRIAPLQTTLKNSHWLFQPGLKEVAR